MYPRLNIHKEIIAKNAYYLTSFCSRNGISVAGVTKVLCGSLELAEIFLKNGVKIIADSRVKNLDKIKSNFSQAYTMLIRIPMISELRQAVSVSDCILVSDIRTLTVISEISRANGKIPDIVYMVDMGDLREGVWFEQAVEEIRTACSIRNINLSGIGTNLGCFGGVLPTVENMKRLVEIKEKINVSTIRDISGGSTVTLKMLEDGVLPKQITNLRIGEGIVCGTDATGGRNVPNTLQDTVLLEAEIIEIKDKPSVPYGETGYDAFGRKHEFIDYGIRKKAILAIGEQDVSSSGMTPLDKNIKVLHSSSDHTIIDITDCEENYCIGDIIDFKLSYGALLRASTSPYVEKIFK